MTRERVGELWHASGNPVPSIAISTTTQGGPSSEVQRVGYTGTGPGAMGGTFTLSFGGQTTSGIAYNASAATVQTALTGLSSIGSGNVAVTKTTNTSNTQEWQVTFQGTLAGADQAQITINTTSVTYMYSKSNIQATDTAGGAGSNNEVQVVTLSNATDGTFRLAFAGQTTAPIAYNASNSTVDTALEALTTIGSGHVSVTGSNGGPWTVTFNGGGLAGVNVPSLQGDAASTQSGSVSHTISYTYDTASQLTAASDSDGELDFAYDYIGRVTSETQIIDGFTPHIVLATKYDAASNRTELASTLGSNADFKNTYLYDNDNRMTRVTQQSNSGNTLATKRVDLAYNALSKFDTIDRYQNTSGTNEVAKTSFTYDTLNRLATLNHDQGGTTLNHYSYGYDRMDRLNSITSTAESTQSFSYDKTSQLTAADHSTQTDESYSYDANGNRTGGSYSTTTNNLTTSDGTYNYTYDDEGNRTRKTNISTGAYEEYTWDYRNRLTNVTSKTSGGTVTKTVDEHYDILNRWTRRHTDPDGPGATAARDNFFAYDGIEPIYQFDGTADTDLIDRYLWGPAIDQILADEQVTALNSAGNIIWPLTDHLGTARDLGDQNESTYTTTVTNHRTYNGFGLLTVESNSGVDCDSGYTGKITDGDTNLQNNLCRWYDMVLGQFASQDPKSFAAHDTNLRRYVGNCPISFTDPEGTEEKGPTPPPGLAKDGLVIIVLVDDPKPGNKSADPPDGTGVGHMYVGVGGYDKNGKFYYVYRGFWPADTMALLTQMANTSKVIPVKGKITDDQNYPPDMYFKFIINPSKDGKPPTVNEMKQYMEDYAKTHKWSVSNNCSDFVIDVMKKGGNNPFGNDAGVGTTTDGKVTLRSPGTFGDELTDYMKKSGYDPKKPPIFDFAKPKSTK